MSPSIEIRTLSSVEDCRTLQAVQDLIWGGDTMSIHVLVTQSNHGGLLQGAFASEGAEDTYGMVGFSFGWPAFAFDNSGGRKLKFRSHIMGVLPAWHGRGIGLELKKSQREELLRQGWTDHVTWTYDPLQRVNARLNVCRLGAVCTTYVRNVYGEMTDSLNAGVPTDRFELDWYLNSTRVHMALGGEALTAWRATDLQRAATRAQRRDDPLRVPLGPPPPPDGRPYALPLPESVDALRQAGGTLLYDWRMFVRQAAESCYSAGYLLVDCLQVDQEWHYIFAPPD